MDVEFTWSEPKRESNRVRHRLDFADAVTVFAGITFTFEDTRFFYDERRYITLGLLRDKPVCIVHTEHANQIHVISFRKATRREAEIYFEEVGH
jgi:uncharacterized DUF497 family protein